MEKIREGIRVPPSAFINDVSIPPSGIWRRLR